MKRIIVIAVSLLVSTQGYAGEAREKFQVIAKQLASLVQEADTNAVVAKTETTFEAGLDTMVYTVHGGSKTGNFSPNTHKETGPRVRGFVISVSVLPLNPIAAESGQTMQQPYWQEYFWAGHGDEKEYIHFIFKFGKRVDEHFKKKVIEVVTGTAQQSPAGDVLKAAPEE